MIIKQFKKMFAKQFKPCYYKIVNRREKMKLFIIYSKDREKTIQNVKYISVFANKLYYLVGEDPIARIVDLNAVATFSMIE